MNTIKNTQNLSKFITLFLVCNPLLPFTAFASETTLTVTVQSAGICGNNVKESGESCDGSDLGGASCASQSFSGGTLSCTASCTFDTNSCSTTSSGGGGGSIVISSTSVFFSGMAYPGNTIVLLKDAQVAAVTVAGQDGKFEINNSGLSDGSYTFSLYSEDSEGIRSSLLTFPVSITSSVAVNVTGILIPPTIAIDKSEFKREDNTVISGQSAPEPSITVDTNPKESYTYSRESEATMEIPPTAYSGEGFSVTGKTFPNAIVKVWLEGNPEPQNMSANVFASIQAFMVSLVKDHSKLHYHSTAADANGNFVLKHPPITARDSGVYTMWAEALDEKGNKSILSSKQAILIQKSSSVLSEDNVTGTSPFLVLLVVLGVIWLWREKFLRLINKLRE